MITISILLAPAATAVGLNFSGEDCIISFDDTEAQQLHSHLIGMDETPLLGGYPARETKLESFFTYVRTTTDSRDDAALSMRRTPVFLKAPPNARFMMSCTHAPQGPKTAVTVLTVGGEVSPSAALNPGKPQHPCRGTAGVLVCVDKLWF